MFKIKKYYIIVIGIAIVGCASTEMDSNLKDKEAKQFKVTPNKANIYIYRDGDLPGSPRLTIMLDQYIAGDTAPKTFIKVSVKPGKHTIKSIFGNVSKLEIYTKAGKNYFVWQETKMGMFNGQTKLHLVKSTQGKRKVLEGRRTETFMQKDIKLQ